MFNRIIGFLADEVNRTPRVVAEAVTEIDDPYAGIVCNNEGIPRHSWCPGCAAEGEARDRTALQLMLPPVPADAVCEDFALTDDHIDEMAWWAAYEDFAREGS